MKLAKDLLTTKIPVITEMSNQRDVIQRMRRFRLQQLPLLLEGQYQGMITLQRLEAESFAKLEDACQKALTVTPEAHPFQILDSFSSCQCESIAVIDDQNQYQGLIFCFKLLTEINIITNSFNEGTWVELIIEPQLYSLSEIARIAEQADIHIHNIHSFVREYKDEIYLLIRINHHDPTLFIRALERYGYVVIGFIQPDRFSLETMQKRAQEILLYLNL